VRNLFDGLADAPIRHAALVTGLKHYLGSFDDYAKTKPYTPFLESSPRLPGLNFYYAQEDVLYEKAKERGFTWSVHRPHTMIGLVIGNFMNMAVTLAVYASICRETGRPFHWPGSQAQWQGISDMTDARVLARQLAWAVTTEAAWNEAFNIPNGDIFRWNWLWPRLAGWFGVEPQGFDGTVHPLEAEMANDGPVWREIAERHGLVEPDLGQLASAWHTDLDLGRPIEVMTDMSKSRKLGFAVYQRTDESFFDLFTQLRADRLIH
jgi:nucleoside-diphosphate-sugar epimerase